MRAIPTEVPGASDVLGQLENENFPVASWLFPSHVRPHLRIVYGFARLVDDLGDEAPGDRLALLDWLAGELDTVFDGRTPAHPLLQRLSWTVRAFSLPRKPFDRLIEANRRDQILSRYETYADVRRYCALSANPVGELVLRVCGMFTPERLALSDDVCTGLQLIEFWQDLGEDAAMGRVYVPLEDLQSFGYPVEDLLAGVADHRFRALMAFEAERTRTLLRRGRVLGRSIGGRLGLAVRLFSAGGLAALGDLERRGFDTFLENGRASRGRRAWTAGRELIRG
jgi:squalene synthase HpnC